MNFIADESVDRHIVDRLRADGHDVVYIAEIEPGAIDEELLTMANDRKALLLTSDKDFGELVFRQGLVSGGVLLMRLAGLSQDTKAKLVSTVIRSHVRQIPQAFTVVTSGAVRIRQLP